MCGIAGFVDSHGSKPDISLVEKMSGLLAHRGPDSAHTQVLHSGGSGPTVVFGHRRLKIIDLSDAAAQPLANEDGSVVVIYNGELYNFRELRHELEAKGHIFRSHSDTEVIVHAYESFGDGFVSRLDGMFAFALWDARRNRVVLARDRVGKKPLYYAWDGHRLAFASEIKALRACPWVDQAVDWNKIPELLSFGYVPWPNTLHRSILQVPPASFMVLENGRLSKPSVYWTLRFSAESGERLGWGEAAGMVRELLGAAVKRRLVSDVPLGVLLSGGIDSSAIVGLMSELGVPVRTFTVGIGDDASYDESRYARLVSEQFGTEHTEVKVRADAAALLDAILWHFDQPFADSSAIPTYLIAREARKHVTVALTGDGGDEVFGGYERFAAALLADRLPLTFQRALGSVARLLPKAGSYYSLRRRLERFAADCGQPLADRYLSWVGLFDDDGLRRLLSPELTAGAPARDFGSSFHQALIEAGDVPLLHQLLYANIRTYLHDDLLVKTDRMTMANSLEARSPFLDTALMEQVALLPPDMKATAFGLKRLLRHSLRGLLPEKILRRRKHGFGVPVDKWFRSELREPFRDLVLARDARSAGAINRAEARRLLLEHLEGRRNYGGRLWTLLALESWLRLLERPLEQRPVWKP